MSTSASPKPHTGFFCGVFGKKHNKKSTINIVPKQATFHDVSITSNHAGRPKTIHYDVPTKFEPFSQKLGFGGCAIVGCFKDTRSDRIVAIKRNKNPTREADLIERDITQYLQVAQKSEPCDQVVKFEMNYERDDVLYYIMEYLPGQDLVTFATNLWKKMKSNSKNISSNSFNEEISYQQIIKITYQLAADILEGMKYIHDRRIVHLDLGKENVMVVQDLNDPTKFHAKIIDFGHAKLFTPPPPPPPPLPRKFSLKRSRSRNLLALIQKPATILKQSSCMSNTSMKDLSSEPRVLSDALVNDDNENIIDDDVDDEKSSSLSDNKLMDDKEFIVTPLETHVGKAEICPPECMVKCPRCGEEPLQVVGKYQRHQKNIHGLHPSQCNEIQKENLKKFDARKIDVFGFGICLAALCFRMSKRMHVQYLMYGKDTLLKLKARTPIEQNVLDHIRGLLFQIPESLQDLIFGCLNADPEQRWSVDKCIEHLSTRNTTSFFTNQKTMF